MNREIRQQVYEKYSGHCAYCGSKIEYKDMQIDHFNPQVFGGSDEMSNLMPACRECNNYKYNYSLEQFRGYLEDVYDSLVKTQKMRIAERLGIFERKNNKVKFYYERN
jgi:endonuclease I